MHRVALILVFALAGCKTAPEVVKVPQIVKVPVREFVSVPESLSAPCPVAQKKANTYGEAVRLANERKASLEECNGRMKKIRELGQ